LYAQIANLTLSLIYLYLAIGMFVALIVVTRGLARIDHETQGAGIGFRAIIFPGVVALWPVLLRRMIRGGGEPPLQKDPHR
jgi:hypothetical protein